MPSLLQGRSNDYLLWSRMDNELPFEVRESSNILLFGCQKTIKLGIILSYRINSNNQRKEKPNAYLSYL